MIVAGGPTPVTFLDFMRRHGGTGGFALPAGGGGPAAQGVRPAGATCWTSATTTGTSTGPRTRERTRHAPPALRLAQPPRPPGPRSLRLVVRRRGDGGNQTLRHHAAPRAAALRRARPAGRLPEPGGAAALRRLRRRRRAAIPLGARLHAGQRGLRHVARQRVGRAVERAITTLGTFPPPPFQVRNDRRDGAGLLFPRPPGDGRCPVPLPKRSP